MRKSIITGLFIGTVSSSLVLALSQMFPIEGIALVFALYIYVLTGAVSAHLAYKHMARKHQGNPENSEVVGFSEISERMKKHLLIRNMLDNMKKENRKTMLVFIKGVDEHLETAEILCGAQPFEAPGVGVVNETQISAPSGDLPIETPEEELE